MKLGILGTGMIVREFLPWLAGEDSPFTVQALCSTQRSAPAAAELCEQYHIPQHTTNYFELLQWVDVVYLAVPNNQHARYAKVAIEAGKHVIVEKPMAINALQAEELANLARRRKVFLFEAMTTQYLAKMVRKAREALGTDSFRVATVGFDSEHDSPDAMRQFARNQGVAGSDWLLLSADRDTAGALMRDLGFTYVTSVRGFDHIIQATVIDAEGVIYRQVYGEVFETPQLVEPLKDLVLGRPRAGAPILEGLFDRIRFFCTTYDPARDAYRFDLSIFISVAIGFLVLGLTAWFALRELWRGRKHRSA